MKLDFNEDNPDLKDIKDWMDVNMELKKRDDIYKWKRYYMMMYLKEVFELSFARIGSFFGLDHASVMNGISMYSDVLKDESDFKTVVESLTFRYPLPSVTNTGKRLNYIIESMVALENDVYRNRFNFINSNR